MSETRYHNTTFILCPHITQEAPDKSPKFRDGTLMVHLTSDPENASHTTLALCSICASSVKGIILERILQNAARDSLRGWR